MKKVGIVTLIGYYNYGNRLQNYALQEAIKFLDFEVESIINETKPIPNITSGFVDKLKKLKSKSLKDIINRLQLKMNNFYYKDEYEKSNTIRTGIFKEFTNNYIIETDYSITQDNIPENLSERYDYFITGSDQVWNPDYIYGSSINFLTFAERKKRVSYAPSFGVTTIPEDLINNYKEWIAGIDYLSVRENDGAKMIMDLTEREAQVLVDPTLLLSKEKWLAVAKESNNKPRTKYLLTYFLGGIPDSHKTQIEKIVKKYNLEVINLGDIKEKESYRTGPSEFIDYIDSCAIFCTDSFHGAVFSIILEKPFIVFEREGLPSSMFSRINTLLDKFDLESRKEENISWEENLLQIDYSHVPLLLEEERNKSFEFLMSALKN